MGLLACTVPEVGLLACTIPEVGLLACTVPEVGLLACTVPEVGLPGLVELEVLALYDGRVRPPVGLVPEAPHHDTLHCLVTKLEKSLFFLIYSIQTSVFFC